MRAGFGLSAGALVPLVLAMSLSARPPDSAQVRVAPSATVDLGRVVRPQGLQQSRPSGASALTADECTGLGGWVVTNGYSDSLCKSKKMCVRQDNNGQSHAVCLEVQ